MYSAPRSTRAGTPNGIHDVVLTIAEYLGSRDREILAGGV
jgi:hypothetical protein